MKIKNAVISAITAASMLLPAAAFGALNREDMYIAESFNSFITNSSPDVVTAKNAGKLFIHDEGNYNKSLEVWGDTAEIKKDFSASPAERFVISFDVKNSSEDMLFTDVGFYTESGDVIAVKIKNNTVYTNEGKRIGGINARNFANIAVFYDFTLGKCTLYADGKCINDNITFDASKPAKGAVIKRTGSSLENQPLYIDNLMAYEANDYMGVVRAVGSYNNEYFDVVRLNDYVGSFCYWDNYYMYIGPNTYGNTVTMSPKTNKIVTERFDYKNPKRSTKLSMIKDGEHNEDCIIDINTAKREGLVRQNGPDKTYSYFTLEGDVCVESGSVIGGQFPLLRDSTGASSVNVNAVTINGTSLSFSDGSAASNVFKAGEWFHYVFALNLIEHTFSVYIDNKPVAENVKISASLKNLSMMRFCLNYGKYAATLSMDNISVSGFEKPYVLGEKQATVIYYDDSGVGDFFKDKIAFHGYGKNALVNNVKTELGDSLKYDEKENKIYVKSTELENLLGGIVPKGESGFTDVDEYAEKNGLHIFKNAMGLIVLADHELKFDMTDEYKWFVLKPYDNNRVRNATQLEAMNDYVLFDRPGKEKLQEMFINKMKSYDVHPRVIIDKNGFDELRRLYTSDSRYKKIADKFIEMADYYCTVPLRDYVYTDTYRMLTSYNEIRNRMMYWGYAWQLTGNRKYADKAWEQFAKVVEFPDANPCHIIDSGSLNEGIAIGFDWMYDSFTEEQRRRIAAFVRKHSVGKIANGFYGLMCANSPATSQWSSFKSTCNYNTWVIGGVFCASMAFLEYDPDYYMTSVANSIRGLEYSVCGFAPSGGWVETPGYGDIAYHYLAHFTSTSEICFGSSFKLPQYQGMDKVSAWRTSVSGYDKTALIGDGSNTGATTDSVMYMDKYYGTDDYRAVRQEYVMSGHVQPELYDVLYYDPALTEKDVEKAQRSCYTRGIETVSVRQSYTDPNGMYFIAHGGADDCYHAHYDTGMFLYEMDGVKWAIDLGSEDYNIGLKDQYVYRKRSEAHNVLTMNINSSGDAMTDDGFGTVTRFEHNGASAITVMDLNSVYKEAPSYKRGYFVGDKMRSLTVRDECTLNTDQTVYWFMNTKADVQIKDNEAILSQDGKTLSVRINCDVPGYEFGVMEAKSLVDLPSGSTGQSKNTGVSKLFIKMKVTKNTPFTVTAKLCAPDEESYASDMNLGSIDSWQLDEDAETVATPEKVGGTVYVDNKPLSSGISVLSVNGDGTLPVITAEPKGLGKFVEIKNAESVNDSTVVTVYNESRKSFWKYVIKYSDFDLPLLKEHNVALMQNFTVSSEPEPANKGANLFDNDLETRWTSLKGGEYAILDFGEELNLNGAALAFWKSDQRKYTFDISFSNDGQNFDNPVKFTSENGEDVYQIFKFSAVKARYMKVTGWGSDANINTNILEMRALYEK